MTKRRIRALERANNRRDSLQNQMTKMLEGMADLKKSVATKEDMKGVNNRLKAIESEQIVMDARLTRIERDKANESRPTVGPRPRQFKSADNDALEYRKARRSVLISPAEATLDGVKEFLQKELMLPLDVVEDTLIQDIGPIHPKKLPAHRKGTTEPKKVHISLRDSQERDLVVSYTSNLVHPARLDIVVPDSLQSLRAKLDGLAYKIKHAKETSDKKVMTSLRLDDKTESLVMAVREDRADPWLHYTLQELRQLESRMCRGTEDNFETGEEDEMV